MERSKAPFLSIHNRVLTTLVLLVLWLAAGPGFFAFSIEFIYLVLAVVKSFFEFFVTKGLWAVRFQGKFGVVGDLRIVQFFIYESSYDSIYTLRGSIRHTVRDMLEEFSPHICGGLFLVTNTFFDVARQLLGVLVRLSSFCHRAHKDGFRNNLSFGHHRFTSI